MADFYTFIKGCQARSKCRRCIALHENPIRFFLDENPPQIQEHSSCYVKKILICLDNIQIMIRRDGENI